MAGKLFSWFGCTVVLLAILASMNDSFADEPVRLRVLSYNIHHGEGIDGKLDLERIARVIRAVEPDIVALQEVDNQTKRTGGVDQAAELARLTKMEVAFGANIDFQGGKYGNAILCKQKLTNVANTHLPQVDPAEQRGVLQAEMQLPGDNGKLVFLATHLDYRRPDAERLASAKVINELASKQPDAVMILAGDLNDTPDSKTLKLLGEQFRRVNDEVLPTVPVGKPERQIDFILVKPAAGWKTIEVRVLEEAVASDHRAIFAVLELVGE